MLVKYDEVYTQTVRAFVQGLFWWYTAVQRTGLLFHKTQQENRKSEMCY